MTEHGQKESLEGPGLCRGQHLARQLAKNLKVDPSGGFEETVENVSMSFPGQIKVLPLEKAKEAATESRPGLTLWSDGSRLANGRIGAGVAWQGPQGDWLSRE